MARHETKTSPHDSWSSEVSFTSQLHESPRHVSPPPVGCVALEPRTVGPSLTCFVCSPHLRRNWPANARSDWPYITDLKKVIEKLPNAKVPQNPKRAVLIQLIALTWRNLSEAQRPALTATAAAAPAAVLAVAAAPAVAVLPPAPPPPAPPPATLAELREQLEFVEKADVCVHTSNGRAWSVAEDVVDEEEEAAAEEAQWQAEAAAAESLVETVLELVTVECRRCFHKFAESEVHYDPHVNHSVCNDREACTLRMPAGGRKRTRTEGAYARLAAGR